MADPALQVLLDPGGMGNGLIIRRRYDTPDGLTASYYVTGMWADSASSTQSQGYRAGWVDINIGNTDSQKATRIRGVLGGSLQPNL